MGPEQHVALGWATRAKSGSNWAAFAVCELRAAAAAAAAGGGSGVTAEKGIQEKTPRPGRAQKRV